MPVSKSVGARIKRREDPRLIQGLAHYVDDIKLPNLLHVAILRSPYAHARINSVNTDAAQNLSGVKSVVTGDDVKDVIGGIPCAATDPEGFPGIKVPHHPVLATGKVRFVGEPIAAVAATDAYIAQDALDLIEVDYEPLDAISSADAAFADGAPVIHEDWDDNMAFTWSIAGGDVDAAFAEADHVVSQRIDHQRLVPNPMETRGVVAQYLPGKDQLNLWSSTQIPHLLRTQISVMLGMAENHVRVIAP
ncbi:MAG: xanthine dehydrogenase family protein molybdopterin-binding subunit, partial [Gemmatimonadetes bacterium]|nr:xanthine dehydrogenase family protein molybdopterin-binding subunit [Gemmatimonadota bacterium]